MKKVFERIGIDVLLFVMVLTTPWWLSICALALAMLYFRFFLEGVLLGTVLDVLFGTSGVFVYTILFGFLFATILFIRPRIRLFTS